MVRRTLASILLGLLLMALAGGSALAAQGQITEVNPSGIGRANNGDPATGDPPPGISVVDGITDVGGPPGMNAASDQGKRSSGQSSANTTTGGAIS